MNALPFGSKVLNVGAGSRETHLPAIYLDAVVVYLDADARWNPDIVLRAQDLGTLPAESYDAVYSAHTLEHFYTHDLGPVLRGIAHVLKPEGFAHIVVPDIGNVLKKFGGDFPWGLDSRVYYSESGWITVHDLLYGHAVAVAHHPELMSHKQGFSAERLSRLMLEHGFKLCFYLTTELFEIQLIATKTETASPFVEELFGLKGHALLEHFYAHV